MNILIPTKPETASVRRGRAICLQVMDRVLELHDKGREPIKITISTALRDDLLAFFDFATHQFDGVLPSELSGVPIAYQPGASRRVHIECRPQ
jgi:hypothetical protein